MFKVAVAMFAFASVVSAQEVAFEDLEQYCEESEVVVLEEAVQDDSEELVLLEDDLVSDSEEEVSFEEN